jgi:hypothetical protein
MRVAAAALAVLVLALPGWSAGPRRATLLLRQTSPLVVGGQGFGARERISVTATATSRTVETVRATKSGRFTARLRLRVGRCTELTVRAVGSEGSRAILQREPGC